MDKASIKQKIEELEKEREIAKQAFHQCIGAIAILQKMLEEESSENKEKTDGNRQTG